MSDIPAILSPERPIRKVKYGWNPDLPDRRDRKYSAPMRVVTRLPPKIDLRNRWMPPVYNQGTIGSCVPNAVAAVCEYLMSKDHEERGTEAPWRPSRLFMYYNARKIENSIGADDGCQIRDVIRSLSVDGFCSEAANELCDASGAWPYDESKLDVEPSPECYECAKKELVTVAAKIQPTLTQLQGCLAEGFPIIFGIAAYESLEDEEVKKTGRVPLPGINERCFGGHALLLVGYDNEQEYFTFRNSWGEEWGDGGYGYLPYSFALDPDCSDDFWTIRAIP